MYSQTCIKRSPFGQRKSDLIRLVTTGIGLTVNITVHTIVGYDHM
jgi:hypothetical protein